MDSLDEEEKTEMPVLQVPLVLMDKPVSVFLILSKIR